MKAPSAPFTHPTFRCLIAAMLVCAAGFARAQNSPAVSGNADVVSATATNAVDPETVLRDMFKKESDVTNTLGMTMVWLKEGYRVARYEVTSGQYQELTGTNPGKFSGALLPAENVTWTEAVQFCRLLTEKEQAAGKLPKGYSYSLPTEKQWEYYVDNAKLEDAITSYLGDRRKPENVGSLGPNDYGLYDTRGNVWEWCTDTVARGASWMSYEDYVYVPFRFVGEPNRRYDDIGFRLILLAEPGSN